jgi:hypothetical protein
MKDRDYIIYVFTSHRFLCGGGEIDHTETMSSPDQDSHSDDSEFEEELDRRAEEATEADAFVSFEEHNDRRDD